MDCVKIEDHYGIIFEGYIDIPHTGVWEFATCTDDGSVLYIDEVKVVDNDGGHAAITAMGKVALKKGIHKYRFLYFEDYEGQELSWSWKAPGADALSPMPDDACTFQFLVPSNFFAVTSLRKAAEILTAVNKREDLALQCSELADEVETALKKYATYNHPEFGTIYAYEVDGFGNRMLMDDANVPSLLAMPYLGDVDINDRIYQNTRRFVWSESNPYFFRGEAGEESAVRT